jgi:carbonic anhydrase
MTHILKLILLIGITLSANASPTKTESTSDFLNEIFKDNNNFNSSYTPKFFKKFSNHQSPRYTYLGCSDSRAHILSFDETPQNDNFSIRNIGNQIVTSEGSIDYGVEVLNTKYLMIVGHSGCGAIKAVLSKKKTQIAAIDKELSTLEISKEELNSAIVENVNNQVQQALLKYKTKIDARELIIIGMIYDFKNDFNLGYGSIILVSENGIKDTTKLTKSYGNKVKYIKFLDN